MAILDYLTGLFESGRVYSAQEVSGLLRNHAAAELEGKLLAELVEGDYLAQDARGYWRADSRPTGATGRTQGQSD